MLANWDEMPERGAIVEAAFEGECVDCGEDINPGDSIRYDSDEDGWAHASHWEGQGPHKTTVCTTCFQVPAANGTCGCG
jgi:hypothetical protein